jgi:hypothetical protein
MNRDRTSMRGHVRSIQQRLLVASFRFPPVLLRCALRSSLRGELLCVFAPLFGLD